MGGGGGGGGGGEVTRGAQIRQSDNFFIESPRSCVCWNFQIYKDIEVLFRPNVLILTMIMKNILFCLFTLGDSLSMAINIFI
jgi:hypothetical protein